MKALLDLILLATLGLFTTCSTRNVERLTSHSNPVPRAIWKPALDEGNQVTTQLPHQRDVAWWLEALKLRPHVVRVANELAVAAVAVRSLERALILASTLPTRELSTGLAPCVMAGNDG